jgi:hypothetical protein
MTTIKHKERYLYSANNVKELTDEISFFTHIDGNHKDCTFIGTWKELKKLGAIEVVNNKNEL